MPLRIFSDIWELDVSSMGTISNYGNAGGKNNKLYLSVSKRTILKEKKKGGAWVAQSLGICLGLRA